MIIDIHRHLIAKEWFSDYYWNQLARMVMQLMSQAGIESTLDSVVNDFLPVLYDTEGEQHLRRMERAGIEKTVVFAYDIGKFVGEPKVPIKVHNKVIFELAKKYPDKIIPFVHIDPRRPKAIEFVKKSIEELGAKGLKLHTGAGFDPSGIETLNLVEAIADFKMPIITHAGASTMPTSSKYNNPILLDDILVRFPEVKVIAAHMGLRYRDQLFAMGRTRYNLYTEISLWQPAVQNKYNEFARAVRSALNDFGAKRVMFGTDSPFSWLMMSDKDYVKAIRDLPTRCPEDISFTDDEINSILGDSAKNLLNC